MNSHLPAAKEPSLQLQQFSTTTTTDSRERGRQLGQRFGDKLRRTSQLYIDFFVSMGLESGWIRATAERSHDALRGWRPYLAQELEACAAAAEIPAWHLYVVNARTEILAAASLAGGAECSTAVHTQPGQAAPQTIQTWDWHDELSPDGLLLELKSGSGNTVKLFTEYGALGKIGVNSDGIGLHFNILSHASDDDSGGVPVHAIARAILDEATSLDDAIAIAASARVSASTAFTIVGGSDPDRDLISIETSPAGLRVVEADPTGWLIRTNHFLDPELGSGDTIPANSATTERFAHLESMRNHMSGLQIRDMAHAMCGAAGPAAVVCFHPDYEKPVADRWKTLLTVGIDVTACALDLSPSNPYDASLTGFTRF